MAYNSLNNDDSTGLIYFINDLNKKFTDLLFTEIDGLKRNFLGLARLDVETGIPHVNYAGDEYKDALFDDNYDIVLFYLETGERKIPNSAAFDSKIDLYVSVNMKSFVDEGNNTLYEKEGIINQVYNIMKASAFEPEAYSRDAEALKAINYTNKVPDSMNPYFIFKITSRLIGNLKVN